MRPPLIPGLFFLAVSTMQLPAARMELSQGQYPPRVFENVTVHGAITTEGKGLQLQVSLAPNSRPYPVDLQRVRGIVFGAEDSLRHNVLLNLPSGEIRKFDGVHLTGFDGTTFSAIPSGFEQAFPIPAANVVYIEPAEKPAAVEQQTVWKAQLSAQAFLVNRRGGKPMGERHRRSIARIEAGYASEEPAQAPVTPKGADALIGKPLPQTRFLGPSGDVVELAALAEGRPLVLVVLRGFPGYICPYCTAQTSALLNKLPEFEHLGARVAFVFPGEADTVPVFLDAIRDYRQQADLPVPVLFDPELSAVRAMSISGDKAQPTTIVMNAQGVVTFAYAGTGPDDRPPVRAILEEVSKALRN